MATKTRNRGRPKLNGGHVVRTILDRDSWLAVRLLMSDREWTISQAIRALIKAGAKAR